MSNHYETRSKTRKRRQEQGISETKTPLTTAGDDTTTSSWPLSKRQRACSIESDVVQQLPPSTTMSAESSPSLSTPPIPSIAIPISTMTTTTTTRPITMTSPFDEIEAHLLSMNESEISLFQRKYIRAHHKQARIWPQDPLADRDLLAWAIDQITTMARNELISILMALDPKYEFRATGGKIIERTSTELYKLSSEKLVFWSILYLLQHPNVRMAIQLENTRISRIADEDYICRTSTQLAYDLQMYSHRLNLLKNEYENFEPMGISGDAAYLATVQWDSRGVDETKSEKAEKTEKTETSTTAKETSLSFTKVPSSFT